MSSSEIECAWLLVRQKEEELREIEEKIEKYKKKENEILTIIQKKDETNLEINEEIK